MLMTVVAGSAPLSASVHALASFAILQSPDAINTGHAIWLEFFCGAVAFFMLIITLVLAGVAIGLVKVKKEVEIHLAEIKGKVYPLIDKSHTLVAELTPQIKEITAKTNTLIADLSPEIKAITVKTKEIMVKVDNITAHAESIAGLARDKVEEFGPTVSAANETAKQANETVREANQKTRQQVERINGMITDTLDATTRLGKAIERGIALPGKEIAGLVAGAKATADHLMHNSGGVGSFLGRVSNLFKGKPNTPATPNRSTPPATYRSMGSLPVQSQSMPPVHMPTSRGFDTSE